MKTKTKKYALPAVAMALLLGMAAPASAALKTVGPVSAENGFPLWYEDFNGLSLALCTDQNGFCLTEEPNTAAPISFPDNFGPEAFWWMAETAATGSGMTGLLVLALEAAFANDLPVEGDQVAFARIRIRVDVPGPGTYTVTHPFGTATYVVPEPVAPDVFDGIGAINETQDIGNFLTPGRTGNYAAALADGPNPPVAGARVNADGLSIGPFLTRADGTKLVSPDGNTYIANPGIATAVTGSPLGTNFFRVVGPGGITIQSTAFNVVGKVSGCSSLNAAPVAVADLVAAASATPTVISVLANDTDTVVDVATNTTTQISPPIGTVAVATQPLGGTAVANPDGTITFTSNAGVSGDVTFTYTVTDPCGLVSAPGTVTVAVDTMRAQKATYRTKFGKWSINGISSFDGDTVTATMGPKATLTGAQEVPAVVTNGTGVAITAIGPNRDSINYTLTYDGLTAVSQAHIHSGAIGVNGPAQAFLCTNITPPPANVPAPPACPATAGTVTGTLTAVNFIQDAAGTATFAEFIDAILAGGTYVNVHTAANAGGEIRGQITRDPLFTTTVTGGRWQAGGKTRTSPGKAPRNVMVESQPIDPQRSGIIDNVELQVR